MVSKVVWSVGSKCNFRIRRIGIVVPRELRGVLKRILVRRKVERMLS